MRGAARRADDAVRKARRCIGATRPRIRIARPGNRRDRPRPGPPPPAGGGPRPGTAEYGRPGAEPKANDTTCLIITHKANILTLAEYVLVLKDGTVSRFGRRDEIMPSTPRIVAAAGQRAAG